MSHFEDRIREEPCGCRTDSVTGITTHYCDQHEPVGDKSTLRKQLQQAQARVKELERERDTARAQVASCLQLVHDLTDRLIYSECRSSYVGDEFCKTCHYFYMERCDGGPAIRASIHIPTPADAYEMWRAMRRVCEAADKASLTSITVFCNEHGVRGTCGMALDECAFVNLRKALREWKGAVQP